MKKLLYTFCGLAAISAEPVAARLTDGDEAASTAQIERQIESKMARLNLTYEQKIAVEAILREGGQQRAAILESFGFEDGARPKLRPRQKRDLRAQLTAVAQDTKSQLRAVLSEAQMDDDPLCVTPEEAYPISTALVPGEIASAFYNTVSPFEYADIERTHLHRADFYGVEGEPVSVSTRVLDGFHQEAYNIVTRERNEAFLYGAEPLPYVVKFDVARGEVAWRTELPFIDDAFNWIGLVVVHGNGDIYAVHAGILVRIDADTGVILESARLPAPEGVPQDDIVYNGFTVAPNGLIVAKSFGRPEGCDLTGTAVLLQCVSDETPQPPSLVATVDPETLEVISSVELPESITGRPAVSQFDGRAYAYLNGIDDVYRIEMDGGDLSLDQNWRFSDFLKDGQTNPTSVVVMGDWVVFQTNGTPSDVPMTIHAVSQVDSDLSVNRDPFSPRPIGSSFLPSSVSADPETMRIYSADTGRGQIGSFELTEGEGGFELVENWVVDQTTLNHIALIGPPEARVVVATDAPGAIAGQVLGNTNYIEQMVWRSAGTGEELIRSEEFGPPFIGGPVTPGFDGTVFYLGLDGLARELSVTGTQPLCEQ